MTRLIPGLVAGLLAVIVGLPQVRAPVGGAWAPLLGVPVAAALYGVAVRRRPARLPSPVTTAVLTVCAALEELFWRGLVLGALALAAGAAGALAVSSALFAGVHRRKRLHLVTGAAFGGIYLATGHLLAPVVAHAAYNLLVCSAAELRGAGKRFGDTVALEDVDLELRYGETLALVGPNGAGKSTAISLLLGLRRTDTGAARLCGLDPARSQARLAVGVVPQEIDLPSTLRVGEIVDLVRAHYPTPTARDALLRRFGLGGLARRQAGGLSGGERRRVAAALAFAGRPSVLFLDEPTAGLDVEWRRTLWAELRAHAGHGGATLLTTHQLGELAAVADRLVVLVRGRVVAHGTTDEVRGDRSLEDAVLALTRR